MSRWLWPWSNCVKERVCRYLLHHYLGHFFQEHLSLDQLSLDLYRGSVALRDIHLETWVRCRGRNPGERERGAVVRNWRGDWAKCRRQGAPPGLGSRRVCTGEAEPGSGCQGVSGVENTSIFASEFAG